MTTAYTPGASEPPRNVSNLRNNRTSVLEPRLVKAPGTITNLDGTPPATRKTLKTRASTRSPTASSSTRTRSPTTRSSRKIPLDIYYSRTTDKGQRYEEVIVTPQDGGGKPEVGWNPLAKDQPQQGAAQLRQTPDGSRMYAVWVEESESGSDIMFRRVDYR